MKKSFTLFELMIVIIIIGIIYSMVAFNFKNISKKEEKLSLQTLKTHLLRYFSNEHLTFICEDDCKKCILYKDYKLIKKDLNPPFQDRDSLKFYKISLDGTLKKADFIHIDANRSNHSVCFRYDIYPNSSSSELVIETSKEVVYMMPYFNKIKKFDNINEFRDYLDSLKREVVK